MVDLMLIENPKRRQGIFQTRKRGIFKKAYEIQALCGLEVLILISENGKLYAFSSCEDIKKDLLSIQSDNIIEHWGPSDFQTKREALEASGSQPRKRKNTSNVLIESQGPEDFQTKRQAIESGELTRRGDKARIEFCNIKFLPVAPIF